MLSSPSSNARFLAVFLLAAAFLGVIAAGWIMVTTEIASSAHAIGVAVAEIPARLQQSVDAAVSDADTRVQQATDAAAVNLRTAIASADKRVGEAVGTVNGAVAVLDSRSAEAVAVVRDLGKQAGPVLANSAALVKDAQDSLDDLYPDLKAGVESGTVAATQTAYAMDAIRAAVPGYLASGQQIADNFKLITVNFAGVTADAHTLTSRIVAPKTTKQKIWEGVKLTTYFAGRAL